MHVCVCDAYVCMYACIMYVCAYVRIMRTYTHTNARARTHTYLCVVLSYRQSHARVYVVQNAALMGKAPADTIKAEEIYSCLGIHSDYMDFLDREFTKEREIRKKCVKKICVYHTLVLSLSSVGTQTLGGADRLDTACSIQARARTHCLPAAIPTLSTRPHPLYMSTW